MEADREPVGLVADALDELEHGRRPREGHRLVPAGHEDQLLALGQAGHGLIAEPQLAQGLRGRGELSPAAVDQHEVGQLLAFLEQPPVAAPHHFAHGGEIVGHVADAAHAELPVVRFPGLPVLERDHGGDHVRALDVRDVEALDAPRLDLEDEQVLESPKDLQRLRARVAPLQVEGEARVAHHHLEQAHLLAALGDADAHLGPAAGAEPFLEQPAIGDLHRHQHVGLVRRRHHDPRAVRLHARSGRGRSQHSI